LEAVVSFSESHIARRKFLSRALLRSGRLAAPVPAQQRATGCGVDVRLPARDDRSQLPPPRAASPGSRALKSAKYEKYCRLRASAQPRTPAYREAGWETSDDDDAYSNACRLERRPGIKDRIEYLSKQQEELIAEKRQRIEERLWAIHEADIGDFFETVEVAKGDKDGKLETDETGKMLTVKKQRPRLLSDLPPELRKTIEHVQLDARGNVVPQLYSKLQANQELRKMLNIGRQKERDTNDLSKLSDAELIQQLADQAKELGIHIDLNYSFHKRDE
jgi:hypothetical protein